MEVKPEDVVEKEVQSKGRVNLGADLEGKTVELAILDVREEGTEVEEFAKEIYNLIGKLTDEMFEAEDMPSESEQVALKRVEQRLENEFT